MAITVQLGSVKKRANSTKRPTNLINYTGEIKSPCSALNPVIVFQMEGDPTSYNYAHISAWDRYYWVSDWTFDRGLWVATMRVDVLASWRDTIGNQSVFVARSSAAFDGSIPDTQYPVITAPETRTAYLNNYFAAGLTEGTYVISVVNNDSNGYGCVNYYALNYVNFRKFANYLMSGVSWLNIDNSEISDNLQKALIDPLQYVKRAVFYPIYYGNIRGTEITSVQYGWWSIPDSAGITYKRISNPAMNVTDPAGGHFTFNIPKHPQASRRGLYLNGAPYSSYTLYLPPFGTFALNPAQLYYADYITMDIALDVSSGDALLEVLAEGSHDELILQTASAQFGVELPLTQIRTDYRDTTGIGTTAISAVADWLSNIIPQGGFFSNLLGTASAVSSAYGSTAVNTSNVGGQASFAITARDPFFQASFGLLTEENNIEYGRPLCKTVDHISNYAGFLMIPQPDVQIACTDAEYTQIVQYMRSGFYYE